MDFIFNSLRSIIRHTHRTFATNIATNPFNQVIQTSKTKRTMYASLQNS